jgi:transcriptional regulator with XRE-family HTH domain
MYIKNVSVQKLGNNIRKHRIHKNYTLEKLSFILELDYSHLSKIENKDYYFILNN